jgi:HAD superfamily hydrolase (TIGR01509 family)
MRNVAPDLPAALIFDVDGTLAETEELHRRAFNETFAEFGLSWQWDTAAYRDLLKVTGGRERMLHFVRRDRPPAPADIEATIPKMHAAKNGHYARLMARGELKLRPGVARLIAEAAGRGVKLAIATTTSHANVAALLDATFGGGAAELFAVIAAGEDVARKKPDPEVYTLALQRLGVPAARCIAFEDSRNGLLAAQAAGLRVVVTPSFYTEHESFDEALATLSDLGEPAAPYRHMAGVGHDAHCVDLTALARWSA